jgi:glutamine synthetase
VSRPSFAARCGAAGAERDAACAELIERVRAERFEALRLVWCDSHGLLRGKALAPAAFERALHDGVGMVSTLVLKDSSDRTAYKVFAPGGTDALPPGFGQANNLVLLPEPQTVTPLPWSPREAWVLGQLWFDDGRPLELDTRFALRRLLALLAQRHGLRLQVGLEVEFHVWRVADALAARDPQQAAWLGPAPQRLELVHPGYQLLGDDLLDAAAAPLAIVRDTAAGLGLPLASLEIELGPSQIEAVFEPAEALVAADRMLLFRHGVRQALARAGYHASFMARPPLAAVMSSGWHLHHSAQRVGDGGNAFARHEPVDGQPGAEARAWLSKLGAHWLAGLIAEAPALALLCCPTVDAYARFVPNALAPVRAAWGPDSRAAMLRVIARPPRGVGEEADAGTRIENRLGVPAANPYLAIAAQAAGGLAGLQAQALPPPAVLDPYGAAAAGETPLPADLGAAIEAARASAALRAALGTPLVELLARVAEQTWQRFQAAEDKTEFLRREYLARI